MVFYRFFAAIVGLALFLFLSVLHISGHHDLYARILTDYGILPFRFAFVDISGSLATWDCTRLGLDVIEHDPCDVLDRSYSYSPLWMAASAIPLGRADAGPVGWLLGFVFLSSLASLPSPRRPFELVVVTLGTLSTMVVFAVERANPDILVFLLALLTGFLLLRSAAARTAGYFVALLAGFVKYYPLTLLIVMAREQLFRFVGLCVVMLAAMAAFVAVYAAEMARGIPLIVNGPYYKDFFAAKNLPFEIGDLVGQAAKPSPAADLYGSLTATMLYLALLLLCAAICGRLLAWPALRSALRRLSPHEEIFLVIGSALIVGCFFAGQSLGYRGIFLLFVLPGLLAAARNAAGRPVRRLMTGSAIAVVLLMWEEFFRTSLHDVPVRIGLSGNATFALYVLFWLARELAWWWVIVVMLSVLLDFLRNSATGRSVAAGWRGVAAKLRRA